MEFELAQLAGPMGGALALAFACGSAAGYQFSERTAVKYALKRVAELQTHVEQTEVKYNKELNEQKEEHKKMIEAQNEIIYNLQKRIKELEESRLHIALNKVDTLIETIEVKKD